MYLVLNLGLKSIRSVIFDDSGKIKSIAQEPLSTKLSGEYVEQSAEEWWDKALVVIKKSLENDNIRNSIRYFSITASSCCVVGVDENGSPLHDIIMVSDKRANKEVEQIKKLNSYHSLIERNPEFEVKSSLMLPKILWIKNNLPDVFNRSKYFLSPNEYLANRLTGTAVVDSLNAEKCFFDVKSEEYPIELLQDLGITNSTLPKVVDVGYIAEQLKPEVKAELKIPIEQSIEYIVTTYDAICAFYGSGAAVKGDSCDVSGTVTSLRTLIPGKKEINNNNIFSQYQREFDISIVGGSNNLGGGLIEWAKQAFYSTETYPYEVMESEAKSIECGADGLIFLPYLMGERAPLWNDNARGVFFGLSRHHNRKHMIRAVFESAGFALRGLSEEIESTGEHIKSIKSSGGLSRIQLIGQLKADITGKEIHIVDEFETTALGAFVLMGISTGLFKDLKSASKIINVRQVIFPNKDNHEKYTHIYQLYTRLYNDLLESYELHAHLHRKNVYKSLEKIENM